MSVSEITLSDLKDLLTDIVRSELKNLKPKEEKYYTRKQVCDLLHIDQSTLYNWKKKGTLEPIYIGGRVYYSQQALDNLKG